MMKQRVLPALKATRFDSVTFVWMQGEKDSKSCDYANVYEASLEGLIQAFHGFTYTLTVRHT